MLYLLLKNNIKKSEVNMKKLRKISLSVLLCLIVVFIAFYATVILWPNIYVKPDKIKAAEEKLNQMLPNGKVDLNSSYAKIKYDSGLFNLTKFGLELQNPKVEIELKKKASSGMLSGLKNKLNKMMHQQQPVDNTSSEKPVNDVLTLISDKTQLVICPYCDFIAVKSVDNLKGTFKNDKDSKFGINHIDAGTFNLTNIIDKSKKDTNRKYNIHANGAYGATKGNSIRITDLFYSHDVSSKLFAYLNKTTDKSIDKILAKYKEYYKTTFKATGINITDNKANTYTADIIRFFMGFIPDQKFYKFGIIMNAYNINMNSQINKALYDILSGIYVVNMNFDINHLTVNIISSLMGFKDKSKGFMQKIQGVFTAIRQDQPSIDINFKVLHKYLTIRSKGTLVFTGYSFVPMGKIYTTITGASNLETALAKNNLLTDKIVKILDALKKNKTSVIEIKSGMPFIYFNNQPITDVIRKIKEEKKSINKDQSLQPHIGDNLTK
jgi:hypothetical protein